MLKDTGSEQGPAQALLLGWWDLAEPKVLEMFVVGKDTMLSLQ